MVQAARDGAHALLVAPTGGGKTLAGFLPSLIDLAERGPKPATGPGSGVHTLYLSPLKALTTDVERNLMTPIREIGLNIHVESRTGDTKQSKRQRQRDFPPDILLTTPESLALMLSYPEAPRIFGNVRRVVLDELHALAENKRGDQLMLGLARLRWLSPALRVTGLSATVEDPQALADFMGGARIIQADPKLGILQGLVVGLPSTSAFARLFQFGLRLGLRSWTIGAAWWQADCGPYWGHNAVIRIAPFVTHCRIPVLPGDGVLDGHVLSHDQIEAAFMRRAGFDVRVLPEEDLGWEQNPPTLIEFLRRDQRWCQGNLQYWPFIKMPGLKPVSRFQLFFAMLMFLASPAWIGMLVFGAIDAAFSPTTAGFMHFGAGHALLRW